MSEPKVGIVILNWNGLSMTKKCIDSVKKQNYDNIELIIIDNGSTDNSSEWLGDQKDITVMLNKKNLGFARAINQGFTEAINSECDYIVSLNNDAVLDKNWLKTLVVFLEENKDINLAQGASMLKHNPNKFDSSGIYLEEGFIPRQRALNQTDPQVDIPTIGPNAAGSIYRTILLKDIAIKPGQYFDNKFFAYVEDVDFGLRATLRGHKFKFVPNAKLLHIGSATGNKIALKKMFWGSRNLVWLVYKNSSFKIIKIKGKKIIKSHLASLQFLWREQRLNFFAYLAGLIVGSLSTPMFYAKRRSNLKKQIISDDQFLGLLVNSNPPLANPLKKLSSLVKYR